MTQIVSPLAVLAGLVWSALGVRPVQGSPSTMFLSQTDILSRLSKGDLVLDPHPDDLQLGPVTVDLRLGNEVIEFIPQSPFVIDPGESPAWLLSADNPFNRVRSLRPGERFVIQPNGILLAVTLEYVRLPADLVGILFPRSALARLGLQGATSMVDPGFEGKLTLTFSHAGTSALALYPGLRFVRLAFVSVAAAHTTFVAQPRMTEADEPLDTEVKRLRAESLKKPETTQVAPTQRTLARLYADVRKAGAKDKGRALEEFVTEAFAFVDGLSVLGRNARLRAEELDIVLTNNITTGFWRFAGSPIIIECKHWKEKVGAREISVLLKKLEAVSPDAKTGIIVAPNGVSGNRSADAWLLIREARRDGRYIIVLEKDDLEAITRDESVTTVVERKYGKLLLI